MFAVYIITCMRDNLAGQWKREEVLSQKPHHMRTASLLEPTEALLVEDALPATGRRLPHPAEALPGC